MKKVCLSIFLALSQISYSQSEFSELPSGIYFKDGNDIVSIDPTLVNSSFVRGKRIIAQIDGKEANYVVGNSTKFYFKFKPEEKELNSTNSNATNKVGEQNYMNLILAGAASSKAISPNEFKLIKLKLSKGKRSFVCGKYKFYGMVTESSIDSKVLVDFKYKKIEENLYEVYFPKGLIPSEYCFIYMAKQQKVFDFSIK